MRLFARTLLFAWAAICANAQHSDFGGVWNSSSAIPVERPAQLKDKEFYTPAEAAQVEARARAQTAEPTKAPTSGIGTYNELFRERGLHVAPSLRTSIVTDPPNGRIPALTPTAAAEKKRRLDIEKNPRAVKDFGLQDRCIAFNTAVPPMLPYGYNSNYRIMQTDTKVIINVEMPHDTRVIHLDRREHLPATIRLWLGDSIGHWEAGTLIVDSTNFRDGGSDFGDAGGNLGWDRNLHVVERFSLSGANGLLYQFEVDDPTAFTRPWKGELTMSRSNGDVYEYACHEGNYALQNLLTIFNSK